jgi:hypothetical protein
MAGRWLDVNSVAEELGISTDAVRKRIARGSLESDRTNGSVLVWLDDSGTEAGHEAQVDGGALLEAKEETIRLLEEQLRLRAEEIQRRDVIISQLTQATSNLTDRLRELEAPVHSSGTSERREEASESVAEAAPRPAPGGGTGASEGSEEPRRRSWWREFFGFD